ncbi:T9SS type A sorting domain-containing protein [Flavobacterium paronense]|uniref:T9SS type A sorting domain-containing protein n=1 Tax=Flavobacterium paronense TaxID=1392775 RepID=A0ABV5GC05_9FLAO|nr:T9SS type A sorting domain-containing protein [Flavobacterium paronense]MDN3677756.1 T9SS type A sorting domain-containing protein [Flavobacterium paronense]
MKTKLLLLVVLCAFFNANATVYYVNKNATGTNNGANWTNAFTTIELAFSNAIVGDQVWVAAGVYKPAGTTRSATFTIPNGVEVYGGFAGTETSLAQRDLTVNTTTLNGDIGAAGTQTDNCYSVVTFTNASNLTKFDGFKIINAYNNLSSTYGGAIRNNNGEPTISNCEFLANYAFYGAAVGSSTGGAQTMTLLNCKMRSNNAVYGGAVYANLGNVKIINCEIYTNTASYGGGIQSENGSLFIDRCKISGNSATNTGGAIRLSNSSAKLEMYNSLIVGNLADEGAVLSLAPISNQQVHKIINCTISGNRNISTSTSTSTLIVLSSANNSIIANSIIWGNVCYRQLLNGNANNCIILGNYLPDNSTNISTTNPGMISMGDGNNAPFTQDAYNYRVPSTSNAVNTGNNSFVNSLYNLDLDATTRIQDTTVDVGSYETNPFLSVDDFVKNRVSIAPNPVSNTITITATKSFDGDTKYSIFDINGRELKSDVLNNSNTINVEDFAQGVYILKINGIDKGIKFSKE